ncbi:MAG: translocation/assembly module TamB domain-containing protein [Caulobacteraceae bacterium]|nr:translocation/assembly module TamB domain-containing protein [Caulobacteraceae bacterium]
MIENAGIEAEVRAERAAERRRTLAEWIVLGLVVFGLLAVTLFGFGRWGVLTPAGRDLVSTFVNGKQISRYGRINVYGLRGDLWDDFTLSRVTVTDEKGVWLEARDVRVDWTWWRLIGRSFEADQISARTIRLIRRPVLTAPEPPQPLPLSVTIDRFFAQVELEEAFAKEYGRWAIAGDADVQREGRKAVRLKAISMTRVGDYLSADAVLEPRRGPRISLIAVERQGGPLAGAMGYSADRPFVAAIRSGAQPGRDGVGHFGAVLRSGDFTPLNAAGDWNRQQVRACGYLAFTGSDLLKPLADRLGPKAVFGLAGRSTSGDRIGIGLVLRTDNLRAVAKGRVNRKTLKSIGPVGVEFSTPSVTRLAGFKVAGAGQFEGFWQGTPDAWRLRGRTVVSQGDWLDLRLARLGGDVELSHDRGRWGVRGEVAGSGGSGGNWIARLLGPQPKAVFDIARLTDGRWLFQRLKVDGVAGRVDGSGSMGLRGGLSFRGKAEIFNARVLHPGARGAISGTFEASENRLHEPWSLSFDARGRGFASGLGELDRVLGGEPRLRARGLIGADHVAITEAVLSGRLGQATAKGLIEHGDQMRLALTWDAKGPFAAGPVEIAGNASGTGALTGTFSEPRADLKARFDQIDLGQMVLTNADVILAFHKEARAYDGRIAVTAGSNYGPAEGRAAFRFVGDGVRLDEMFVNAGGLTAQGSLALRGRNPSSADILFRAQPGAFIESGFAAGRIKLTDGPADASAIIDVTGENLRLKGSGYRFRALRLSGKGTLARLPFLVSADVAGAPPIKFEGEGVYMRTGATQSFTLEGQGRVRRADFRTLSPMQFTFNGPDRLARLDLGFANGRLLATAHQTGGGFDARADLTGVDLAAIGEDLGGKINGVLILNGRGATLGGSLDATIDDARSTDGPRNLAVDGAIKAQLTDSRLRLQASAFDEGGLRAETNLDLPVVASAAPLHLAINRTEPMSGSFSIKGQVKPVWDLLLGGDRSLGGNVDASGTLAGTLKDPLINGRGAITEGRFDDVASGLTLRGLTANMVFDRQAAIISGFSANDGRADEPGTVTGEGRIEFRSGGASSFTLQLKGFEVVDNDMATARASGPIKLERASNGQLRVTGDLTVTRAEIAPNPPTPSGVVRMEVTEINRPIREADIDQPRVTRGPGVLLDVKLKARRNVILQGRGLDVEFSLNAQVTGSSADPLIVGEARIIRGTYEFAGKRFTFDERGYVTLSTKPENIRLDLRAIREDPALTAVIRITGTAAKPVLSLTSSPVLPQDEILAQILFGRSASQLSGVEAAQLASSVASLAGGGGLDVIGNIRQLAGLDRLAFGSDQYGMTVAGGKYINDNIYFEVIGGGRESQAVQVEWRVRRNLAVVSRIGGQGDAKLSIRWRREERRDDRRGDRRNEGRQKR